MVRANARAVIFKFNFDHFSGDAGADSDLALLAQRLHGLPGIAENIDEDLLQLVGVAEYGGKGSREVLPHLYVPGAQVVGHDLEHFLDDIVQQY